MPKVEQKSLSPIELIGKNDRVSECKELDRQSHIEIARLA